MILKGVILLMGLDQLEQKKKKKAPKLKSVAQHLIVADTLILRSCTGSPSVVHFSAFIRRTQTSNCKYTRTFNSWDTMFVSNKEGNVLSSSHFYFGLTDF
jgi:hypothetical protein